MSGQPQLRQESPAITILAVDDETAILDLCARTLKQYTVLKAANGQQALDIMQQQRVDLVLTDVMIPVMSGLELLEKIREKDPEQLVVIMTGFGEKEILLRALKAKADDFIPKPLNLIQLQTTISKALERKRLRQELLQLKQLDRLKTEFLGLISHKLRTPATSISLFIQNLASGAVDHKDADFESVLSAIRKEADYLAHLIQDLLYYSDVILRDEQPELSQQDIREIALSTLAKKKPLAEEKGVDLLNKLTGLWPPLPLDRQRLRFTLDALFDNAIKFTPAGGQVILSGEIGESTVTLAISDNGPGISAENLPRVFEKFYQVDPARAGQVRGFGLGLFYARKFIGDHHGKLILDSEPGEGTTVIINLPRLQESHA
jgi:signal transduction histidine kinase